MQRSGFTMKLVVMTTLLCTVSGITRWSNQDSPQDRPEGYYAFIESPNAEPPRVRRPPYVQSNKECPGIRSPPSQKSLNNLCGDLNKGFIPQNPMGQNVLGAAYPFELLKNKTLQFLSKTLPILKADDTLPKVAKYHQEPATTHQISHNSLGTSPNWHRTKREEPTHLPQAEETHIEEGREARKFCENGGGFMCMLYKAFNGEPLASGVAERREDISSEPVEFRRGEGHGPMPPTPCPAKVEYATPVFAKNYQGVWRYVVQIPYEGYFTQTLEVTRCLQSRCHYMDGGCLSSPRWVSLLVAEIYYPETLLPNSNTGSRWPSYRNPVTADNPPPVQDFQNYQQYLRKRAGAAPDVSGSTTPPTPTQKPSYCDGVDEIGCFQVRLYYDWFLVPGSCKCWKPDYFSRYIRRKVVGPDL